MKIAKEGKKYIITTNKSRHRPQLWGNKASKMLNTNPWDCIIWPLGMTIATVCLPLPTIPKYCDVPTATWLAWNGLY